MREIRFRGRRFVDDEWVNGNLLDGERIAGSVVDWDSEYFCTEFWWTIDPDTVGQYTGLKDKNGKEIYEGDILSVTSELLTNFGNTRTGVMSTSLYEVLWHKDSWGTKVLRSEQLVVGRHSAGLTVKAKYGEIIGNIYEHPHLLGDNQ